MLRLPASGHLGHMARFTFSHGTYFALSWQCKRLRMRFLLCSERDATPSKRASFFPGLTPRLWRRSAKLRLQASREGFGAEEDSTEPQLRAHREARTQDRLLLEVTAMTLVPRRPTTEQVWIARLFDSCCSGGYGHIAASRSSSEGLKTPSMVAEDAAQSALLATKTRQPRIHIQNVRERVGSANS